MKKVYAKFLLWLIRPALEEHRNQLYRKPVTLAAVQSTTRAQQDEVTRDLRSRLAKKPELHQ